MELGPLGLVFDVTYRDGWGKLHKIAGLTKENQEWVWSYGGDWFRRSDGRAIRFTPERGYYAMETETNHDLKGEW